MMFAKSSLNGIRLSSLQRGRVYMSHQENNRVAHNLRFVSKTYSQSKTYAILRNQIPSDVHVDYSKISLALAVKVALNRPEWNHDVRHCWKFLLLDLASTSTAEPN